jgi:hypothetical protein
MMGWRGGWLAEGAADANSQAIGGWYCRQPQCPGFKAGKVYYKDFGDPKSGPRRVQHQPEGGKLMFPQSRSCHFCNAEKTDTKSCKREAQKEARVGAAREAPPMSLQELCQEAARKKEEVCMGVEHGVRM